MKTENLGRPVQIRQLASFLAGLRFEDLPDEVVEWTKDLFIDWLGSSLAGKDRQIRILEEFVDEMGPGLGDCEILVSQNRTSPLFATLPTLNSFTPPKPLADCLMSAYIACGGFTGARRILEGR